LEYLLVAGQGGDRMRRGGFCGGHRFGGHLRTRLSLGQKSGGEGRLHN
jgi:hypothetical protein